MRSVGRCEMQIVRRPRGPGAEASIAIRLDRRDVEGAIHELATTIGMRVTLTPITGSEDGSEE